MYLALGMLSIVASGAGVYYCVTNKVIKREDIEICFKKVDDQINILDEKFGIWVSQTGNKFDQFIQKISKQLNDDEEGECDDVETCELETLKVRTPTPELGSIEEQGSLLYEPGSELETKESPKESPKSSSLDVTLEEFVLLYDGQD